MGSRVVGSWVLKDKAVSGARLNLRRGGTGLAGGAAATGLAEGLGRGLKASSSQTHIPGMSPSLWFHHSTPQRVKVAFT